MTDKPAMQLAEYIREKGAFISNLTSSSWVAYDKLEYAIIKQVENQGDLLENWILPLTEAF